MMKVLTIIDISSFIFRAFFAIRPLSAPDGTPVNAVHGVVSMLLRVLSDYRPTHVVIAADTKEPSFRKEIFPAYKANRSEPPEELIPQFALIQELCRVLKMPTLRAPGYEADDIIGTLATQWTSHFDKILIISGDKDLMQFVNDKVHVVDTMKGKTYDSQGVYEKMGVYPPQIVDYLAMVGDASDNIPGMKGIGKKGAESLLKKYNTLEETWKNRADLANKRLINAFENHYDDALLSKKLIKIVQNVPVPFTAQETQYGLCPDAECLQFFENLGLRSHLKKLREISQIESVDQVATEEANVSFSIAQNLEKVANYEGSFSQSSLKWAELSQVIIHGHVIDEKRVYFLGLPDQRVFKIDEPSIFFSTLAQEFNGEVIALDSKTFLREYFSGTMRLQKIYDLNLLDYLLRPGDHAKNQERLFSDYQVNLLGGEELSQRREQHGENLFLEGVAENVVSVLSLFQILEAKVREAELWQRYESLEQPVLLVLAKMEEAGILLDVQRLTKLKEEYEGQLQKVKEEILSYSKNQEINLSSPKQMSFFLYEELQLPILKKNKTGPSTDASVLQQLAKQDQHPVPELLLRYRELDKLVSTYIAPLPSFVAASGRIHTCYNQRGTVTGRLSSENPNLQNLPIKTPQGRRIRQAFIASPGHVLLTADYSQIELRILAHFSQDPTMVQAFLKGLDIHAQTASEVFEIPLEKLDATTRNKAKAINFGLIYGQGAYGLSQQLQISRKEAQDYIDLYFKRFAKIKDYFDTLVSSAKEKGYAETWRGHRRKITSLESSNFRERSQAMRLAVNTPIQGTAADIIKLAMIELQNYLEAENRQSKILLQIHDELVFEVPQEELDALKVQVPKIMEGVVNFSIPLQVDVGVGEDLYALKG